MPELGNGNKHCVPGCTCGRHKALAARAQFKGAEVGRSARHRRVVRRRGSARTHECVHCLEHGRHTQGRDWAQLHCTDGQDPWADYVALCRPCHRAYDRIGERQRGMVRNPHHDSKGRFTRTGFATLGAALALTTAALLPALPAQAQPAASPSALAGRALNWAEAHALGHPYVYGGAGPGGYDCSGLVMAAYAAAGVALPHNTVAMLTSGKLTRVPIGSAPRGALLFFGSGHVELKTMWRYMSFGAHHSGTTVGWRRWSPGYYEPTAAYVVTGG